METFEYHGFTIEIRPDDSGCGALDEMFGGADDICLYAWHRRYAFGPTPPAWATEAMEDGRLHEALRERHPRAVVMPVYLLDHSGLRLSTGFCDPWDSGQIGVIFAPEPWLAEDRMRDVLRRVVREMDDRVSGNVWGYVVRDSAGVEVDSCCGYVGDPDDSGVLEAARAAADCEFERRASGERLVRETFAL